MSSFDEILYTDDNSVDNIWRVRGHVHVPSDPKIVKVLTLPCRPSFKDIPSEKTIQVKINKSLLHSSYNALIDALSKDNENDYESYDGVVKQGNIILDMDGTLGDHIPIHFPENPDRYVKDRAIPRPGLREFLRFVFAHYERVSIWTAATKEWYNEFYRTVLMHNLPLGASFHFVRTRNPNEVYVPLKPLSEIYAMFPAEYNESNTTIVDDNYETFKANISNAVHIPAFFYDRLGDTVDIRRSLASTDANLLDTINILKTRLRGIKCDCPAPEPVPESVFECIEIQKNL
jgi:hypothetical protein